MIKINFLAYRRKLKSKEKEQDQKLFKISSYLLIGIVILTVAAFASKLYINLRIKNADLDISKYRKTILAQENTEIDYLIFVNKLKVISEIYKKRSDKQEAMNYFSEICKETADIIGMNYQEDQGGLILQLSNENIFKLEKTMEILDSEEVRSRYQDIKKTVLNRTELGNYKLTLQLELKAKE